MRRIATAALAGALAFSGLGFTSAAAPEPLLVDPAGDANGVNGQGVVVGGPGDFAGGPSAAWADLLSFRVVPGAKKTELRLGVSDLNPPTNVIFRMMTDFNGCAVWFQVLNYGGPAGSIRFTSACGSVAVGTYADGITVELDEETGEYVFAIEFKGLPKEVASFIKPGAPATTLELSARTFAGSGGTGATVPQLDDAVDEGVMFKI